MECSSTAGISHQYTMSLVLASALCAPVCVYVGTSSSRQFHHKHPQPDAEEPSPKAPSCPFTHSHLPSHPALLGWGYVFLIHNTDHTSCSLQWHLPGPPRLGPQGSPPWRQKWPLSDGRCTCSAQLSQALLTPAWMLPGPPLPLPPSYSSASAARLPPTLSL